MFTILPAGTLSLFLAFSYGARQMGKIKAYYKKGDYRSKWLAIRFSRNWSGGTIISLWNALLHRLDHTRTPFCHKCHEICQQTSRTAARSALKATACSSDWTVSALRNHVHYHVNNVFEGHRPQDLRGEVYLGCWSWESSILTLNIHQGLTLMTCH